MTEHEAHVVEYVVLLNEEIEAVCSCGARWTFPKGTPLVRREDILRSHIAYATKQFRRAE